MEGGAAVLDTAPGMVLLTPLTPPTSPPTKGRLVGGTNGVVVVVNALTPPTTFSGCG